MTERWRAVRAVEPNVLPQPIAGTGSVDSRASSENFPVALRVLPATVRADLLAIYGFARLTDELGDSYPGDRLAALDWLERDLDAALVGRAEHPVVARLTPVIQRHRPDTQHFRDLIEANRRDQFVHRYATFDELLGYCRLSANPVGRLVLAVFDARAGDVEQLSDRVCSGLQVVEHIQDVAEDLAAGRIYLPKEDLARCGVTEADLAAAAASPAVRRVIELECDRARDLLAAGGTLVRRLHGWARPAVAGFTAGGLAALDAIADARYDVLAPCQRPARRRVAFRAGELLLRRRPPSRRSGRRRR